MNLVCKILKNLSHSIVSLKALLNSIALLNLQPTLQDNTNTNMKKKPVVKIVQNKKEISQILKMSFLAHYDANMLSAFYPVAMLTSAH